MVDYSFKKYIELCKTITDSDYEVLTMQEYFSNKNSKKFILLRHDIDHTIIPGLDMAKMENEMGIKSTYYIRSKKKILNPEIIKQIGDLGHEIGYHYETLDKAGGDYNLAIKIFEEELNALRKYCQIRTIAMHGNPLSKYNNRDLWQQYDFKKYGLSGEAYLSIDFNEVCYLSDSGRSWDEKYKIHDITTQTNAKVTITNTDELIDIIENNKLDKLYILTHPIIWTRNKPVWYKELVRLNIIKVGKIFIKCVRKC